MIITREELDKRGPRDRAECIELARFQLQDLRDGDHGVYSQLMQNMAVNGIDHSDLDPAKNADELGREILELRDAARAKLNERLKIGKSPGRENGL